MRPVGAHGRVAMIITATDLNEGAFVLLPPGWESRGGIEAAQEAQMRRVQNAKWPRELPLTAIAMGADTSKGVLACPRVFRVKAGCLTLEGEGPEGTPVVEEKRADYDVVHRATGIAIAQVRHV